MKKKSSPKSGGTSAQVNMEPAKPIVPVGTTVAPELPTGNTRLEDLPEILTRTQLAQFLQVKPRAIFNLTRARARRVAHGQHTENKLPVLRLGVGMRFAKASVLAWLSRAES
jgi:hypothetical protein